MNQRTVSFICKSCNGTGRSRWYEGRDCDQCDGRGTITTYLDLTEGPVGIAAHKSARQA